MLIEIKDKVVSLDIFEQKFVCDLNACKGACCIEGNSGAPLQLHEIDKTYLTHRNLQETVIGFTVRPLVVSF